MLSARRTLMMLGVCGVAGGCATRAESSRDAINRVSAGDVLTAKELASIAGRGSLMDALARLRPAWLTSRGANVGVSVDGAPPAELSVLRTIELSTVYELRLERSSSSTSRSRIAPNGHVILGNMIVVTTRP